MGTLRFSGVMQILGINPYVLVTKDQAEKLVKGWRKPMPVMLRVNGEPKDAWHINMMPAGDGNFYLYLHGDVRKASSTNVGDDVSIELEFDEAYKNGPQHEIPSEFSAMLRKISAAQTNWDALPPSRQKEILRYFASLKSDDAKQRNYERAFKALSGAPGQFMGRRWRNGA